MPCATVILRDCILLCLLHPIVISIVEDGIITGTLSVLKNGTKGTRSVPKALTTIDQVVLFLYE